MSWPTISRVLRLLALLQARRFWSGRELAARLGVSGRTLRRDIEQLRELGYNVTADRGYDGGYSLEPGTQLPPLLLDDDELVVLAVGLRTVAARTVGKTDETALSTLAKLEQLLPSRLRRKVAALQSHTHPMWIESASSAQPELIARLALACRDSERVRFGYTDATETTRTHFVEPHSLISAERGWWLVAWDLSDDAWYAFRVTNIDSYVATGTRFTPHDLDSYQAGEIVTAAEVRFARRYVGLLRIHAPVEELRAQLGTWVQETTAESPSTTLLPISADYLPKFVFGIAWIPDHEFEIVEPDELAEFARSFGSRLLRAASRDDDRGWRMDEAGEPG